MRSASGLFGVLLLTVHLVMAALGPSLTSHRPEAIDPEHQFAGPSSDHLAGTDQLGRDVLARTVAGGRAAVGIAAVATLIAIAIGGLAGIALGYRAGLAAELALRVADAVQAIPGLLLFLAVVTVTGPRTDVLVALLAFVNMPGVFRVARAATLEQVTRDYVTAARARGESFRWIVLHELFPNVRDVLLVELAMRASWMVLSLAALSFLGFGVSPPTPDWGLMVAENRSRLALAPLATLSPALALTTLVIGLNLTADALAKQLGVDAATRR
jgi:peptide/nickel transport system permease protein